MIKTFHQGIINVQAWEFILIPVYLFVIFLIASRIKNMRIKEEPVYRFYLWGLYAKIFGGLAFAMVYIYYYHGGDTMTYYETAMAMVHMFFEEPTVFFRTLFGPKSTEVYTSYSTQTGFLVDYVYRDQRSFMVCRLISPLQLISFNSYILTTILVSCVTYSGLWKLFLMFSRYYPKISSQLAVAVLFMPSTIFWGSGIMKDSFTMAATGFYAYYIDMVFIRRNFKFRSILYLTLSAIILISLKPYIFMVLFPGALYWIFNDKVKRIRNTLVRYLVMPSVYALVLLGTLFILETLGDKLGKFSLDKALVTASISQKDLKAAHYEGSSFDIGDFEPTVEGAMSKFLPAVNAGLFRPYLWEANNAAMLASGLENLFLISLFILVLLRSRIIKFVPLVLDNPLVMFCLLFAIFFAFIIGLTTSNFGAMVRFKIPLLPFFVSAMYIMLYHIKEEKRSKYAIRRSPKPSLA